MDEETYSATEVVAALDISRPAFDSWVLRGYLGLERGPGTGRARRLTFEEVVRVAALYALVRNGITAQKAGNLLLSVEHEFRNALRDNDGRDYVMMIEESQAKVGTRWFLDHWMRSWALPDQSYPPIDPNAPDPPDGIFDLSKTSLRSRVRWLGELPGAPSDRTDPLTHGPRPVFASMLHIGNLVQRTKAALRYEAEQ